jgi:hypothetical protein
MRAGSSLAIFADIELVSIVEGESPDDAYTVTFDVIYPGETWCRSAVGVSSAIAAQVELEERAVVRAARDALLEVLIPEPGPVSLQLQLTDQGIAVLARAVPGERSPRWDDRPRR